MRQILDYLEPFKELVFWHNSVYSYILAGAIFAGLLIILKIVQIVIIGSLRQAAKKTKTDFDDVLIKIFAQIKPPFYFLLALYFAVKSLAFPVLASKIIGVLFILVLSYEIIKALEKVIDFGVQKYIQKKGDDRLNKSLIKITTIVFKAGLWLLAITIILSNLGFNVTSLIAGLGIGGIAVALALQNILSDMFSSFSIFVDRPFEEGDFISAGADKGTVTKIGMKTTRIQTPQGEELVVPNKELTDARIQNFRRMEKRRDLFQLGVVYGTHPDKLERIPKIIQKVIAGIAKAEFNRCHFKDYGESSLNFEIAYFVLSREYEDFLNVKQQVNLGIYKTFKEEGIEFAYPTQTLFIEKS